ncbi:MAG: hypothetical protein KF849_05290 [Rhizobiaceae bacterium]|nr:hypothetical protein [Rhizobiaceae bacterium]
MIRADGSTASDQRAAGACPTTSYPVSVEGLPLLAFGYAATDGDESDQTDGILTIRVNTTVRRRRAM